MRELTQQEVAELAIQADYGIANPRETPPTYEMRRAMKFYELLRQAMTTPAPEVWQPFWLETNEVWGLVEDRETWVQMRQKWETANCVAGDQIYNLKCTAPGYDSGSPPEPMSFGERIEHLGGTMTLRQFFQENGMRLEVEDGQELTKWLRDKGLGQQ